MSIGAQILLGCALVWIIVLLSDIRARLATEIEIDRQLLAVAGQILTIAGNGDADAMLKRLREGMLISRQLGL